MADLTYVVTINHKERGVGFSIRTALQNAQRQSNSPITQATFQGPTTGSETKIQVVVSDTPLCETIRDVIKRSGRVPQEAGAYTIQGIELQGKGPDLEWQLKELQANYQRAQRELAALRGANARFTSDLRRLEAGVSTPLEGVLAYFSKTNYVPEVVLDNPEDGDFAGRVFSGDIKNTFLNYASHVLVEDLTQDSIEKDLNAVMQDSGELIDLRSRYEAARRELEFLVTLQSGHTEIPETLRPDYIKLIEEKGHGETVRKYESAMQEQEKVMSRQKLLTELKEKYDSFSEKLNLLTEAGREVPVIFNRTETGIDLYFPFCVRKMTAGFISKLGKEVGGYFGESKVGSIENGFVAYRVNTGSDVTAGVNNMVGDIPVTLRVAGFNRIIPYRLG